MDERDVVVIGAGPAGVASGVALKDAGLRPLLLDGADVIASSWRKRYDRLRLNSCRPFSHLPGRRFARGTPMFPTRDQLIDHLEHHAGEEGIDVRLGCLVARLDTDGDGWRLDTSGGPLRAAQVIVATGYEQEPVIPPWPGLERFAGTLVHSSDYRNPQPFKGLRVLVVGAGSSGMEIAHDLAGGGAAKVWMAVRTPPNILLRAGPGGLPGDVIGVALLHVPPRVADAIARAGRRMDVGDLTPFGLPVPDEGPMTRMRRLGVAPAIVDKEVIEAIRQGDIEVVPGVEDLDATGAKLSGAARVDVDAVVCATGYRRGLEPLVGHLGVLDDRGVPVRLGPRAAAPGLRFVGYVPRPGGLGYMGKQAAQAARLIARELRAAPTPAVS